MLLQERNTAVTRRLPPHVFFFVSAVFHYLGPSFAVLLFSSVSVLGVAWFRIASAAVVFAVWRRPWRLFTQMPWGKQRTLLALGAALGLMNACFYLAIARLPLGTVGAIEFLGPIALAALGARTRRNIAALLLAIGGVWLLTDVRLGGQPLGFLFAFANCAFFMLYVILGHRIAQDGGAAGIDRLGASMLIALVTITPLGGSYALPAMTHPLLVLAGVGVGICSSVIPYVCDQLAMARLPRATFALLLSLLPASATVIGVVVLRQIPSILEIVGILLVAGGVALHREAEALPGKQARKKASAEERLAGAGNRSKGRNTHCMTLQFGVLVPQGWTMDLAQIKDAVEAYETMTRVAQTAEEVGFASAWLVDHFHTIPHPSQEVAFECWTSTAALARDTKTIRIGQMVTCNGYRHPALLAKMASTVDVLSHGRLSVGIGAGWYEHEYRAYGYAYPDAPQRLRQLREAVQVILAMWQEEEAHFEGVSYQVRGAINQPKGVQPPHIPLLIGGDGEQVTLKLVAQYADARNVGSDPATVKQKLAVLKQHCERVGRDYESIHRTSSTVCLLADSDEQARALLPAERKARLGNAVQTALIGSPETIRKRLVAYEAAGVQELVLRFVDGTNLEALRRFAKEFIA